MKTKFMTEVKYPMAKLVLRTLKIWKYKKFPTTRSRCIHISIFISHKSQLWKYVVLLNILELVWRKCLQSLCHDTADSINRCYLDFAYCRHYLCYCILKLGHFALKKAFNLKILRLDYLLTNGKFVGNTSENFPIFLWWPQIQIPTELL
jgi:hypothetical protein